MALNLTQVFCDRQDCLYSQENKCSNTGIHIGTNGYCEDFIKEELPDYHIDPNYHPRHPDNK
jgi:hypothetical protein